MIDISELRSRVTGPVLVAGDPGFAEEVAGYNLAITHTPDVAIGVTSASDVLEAVQYARELALPVRVQSTGHGASTPITDGVLITTKRLVGVTIDPDKREAVVAAGARWGDVIAAAAPFGLAPVAGAAAGVGVVGYLVGGGLGPLSRSHGFSSDHVRGFSVVTGRGELVDASEIENDDLFWALRGGKDGLGVVTEVRISLIELPVLYGGSLLFENENIEAVLRGWLEYTASAPDDVTTSISLLRFPPIDAVPAPMRGKNFAALRFAFPGAVDEGERLAAPLRALAPVFVDSLGALAPKDIGLIHNDPDAPTAAWSTGTLLAHADTGLADTLLSAVGPGARIPFVVAEVRHLGAATRTDVPEGSAVGGRSAAYTFTLVGAPEPSLFAKVIPDAAQQIFDTLRPWINDETTANFAGHGEAGTPAGSAATLHRLDAVRAAHDPERVFPRA
jgi:FAD/FMN-containing dehydrogenase